MADKKFELGDYVEVKDRLKLFYELFGHGSIVTEEVLLTSEPDGKPRVMVRAAAYRTPDDPHPGIGYSWLELPGSTPYTRGSEVENAETSAWGRAIASLGILVDRSIASAQEVQNKAQDGAGATQTAAGASARTQTPVGVVAAEGGLIGIAALGKTSPVDGEVRQTDAGMSIGFVIGEGRDKVQVVAYGPKAEAFHTVLPSVLGKRVQVFGPVSTETMKVGSPKRDVTFPRVRLERLVTPDATFDFTDEDEPAGPPDDIPLIGEALPPPLFDDVA